MDPQDLRVQVIRRLRYGLNVVALEGDLVPPEGPMDVALTNGLLAILASIDPAKVLDLKGRTLPASKLLDVAKDLGLAFDFDVLRELLDVTRPLRHGRADDEWITPGAGHLEALVELDEHPALRVLELARATPTVEALIVGLYREAASEEHGIANLSPKDRLLAMELEHCDWCGRETFLPNGFDVFGGTNTSGLCVACGHQRSEEAAWETAVTVRLKRLREDRD